MATNRKKILAALALAVAVGSAWLRPGAAAAQAMTQSQRQQLFLRGAQLWPVKCMQCHNARPGGEFTPEQWKAIVMHMRTLANLPPEDAQAVLEYLKGGR
jgi:mono/diheme cytochrome c family protein